MVGDIKTKHLKLFIDERVDVANVMREVLGFNYKGLKKYLFFTKYFNKAYKLMNEMSGIDLQALPLKESWLRIPSDIDHIPLIARLTLESKVADLGSGDLIDNIVYIVALGCYYETTSKPLDVNSPYFREFKHRIYNTPFTAIIPIFNWIKRDLERSVNKWEGLFKQVEVLDKDYDLAGGFMMKKFNVINTIRNICQQLNVNKEDAWQVSYTITQTMALSDATSAYIQKRMTDIKENRMRQQRLNPHR